MTNSDVSSDRLVLVPMSLELMEALLCGDLESAQRMVGYPVSYTHLTLPTNREV